MEPASGYHNRAAGYEGPLGRSGPTRSHPASRRAEKPTGGIFRTAIDQAERSPVTKAPSQTSFDRPGKGSPSLTQGDLDRILDVHDIWLLGRAGGRRACLRQTDLSCLDLSGRTLSEADLGGCCLAGATLVGTNLNRANLFAADLRGANLEHSQFRRADLRGARLRGARISHAVFIEADLRCGLQPPQHSGGPGDLFFSLRTDLSGATLVGARFPRADLSAANLSGTVLEGADFTEATLDGANLRDADLTAACLRYASLRGADLAGAVLESVDLMLADLTGTALESTIGAHHSFSRPASPQ